MSIVNLSSNDQLFARYSFSGGHNLNPVSIRGTDAPGFPTRDDLRHPRRNCIEHAHPLAIADELAARGPSCVTSSCSISG